MDFRLNDEQRALMDNAEKVGRRLVYPSVRERDRTGRWDPALWKGMGEAGLLGLPYPEEYGGSGLSCLDTCLVKEAFSKGAHDGGVTLALGASMILCGVPIWKLGSEEQRKRYLPKMTTGEWLGAFCLSEPGSGSDAASMKTRAEKKGDRYILNGTKMWITNGPLAHHMIVTAVTDPTQKAFGISTFIVDADCKGFRVGQHIDKLGMRTSMTSEIIFEDCEVPEEALLGQENFGFVTTAKLILGWERTCLLAPFVGSMEGALEACVEYAKTRQQFGRPIGKFQAIRHKLADMKVWLEIGRNLVHKAAWMIDQGEEPLVEAAVAKLYISEMGQHFAREAIQIHGGNGFTTEYELERMYRDCMLATIGGGTSEVQRSIIARSIMNLGY
ncbi:MAG: acyl-CoA dehydrogenase family protein [Deltaproteobacteria bacterium]|nr:acyl-CoA dehydrogenase family protein [Deltaproteobacteria bacterium]